MIILMLQDVLKVEGKKAKGLLLVVRAVLLQTHKSIVQATQMIHFVNLVKDNLLVVKDNLLVVKDSLLVVKDSLLLVV